MPTHRRLIAIGWLMPVVWLLSLGCAQAATGHWDVCPSFLVRRLTFCRTFQERINAAHCTTQACATRAVLTDPRFTDPPWKVLNPRHHETLIMRLLRHSKDLSVAYQNKLSRPAARLEARLFIAAGGEIWLWHGWVTPVLSFSANSAMPPQPVPPGPQTIVDLHMPAPPGHPVLGWDHTYLVTPKLRGPDSAVNGDIFRSLEQGRLRLMHGTPYIVGGGILAYPVLEGGFFAAVWFPKDMPGVYKK
ncbi:MAG: hypothetical protein ACYDEV_00995 [Acidiferrobacter sp.]